MKITLKPENEAELQIVVTALTELMALRNAPCVWTSGLSQVVPPMTLEECVEEIEMPTGTVTNTAFVGYNVPSTAVTNEATITHTTATVEEAVTALREAVGRGVDMKDVIAVLVEADVVRVTELDAEGRGLFVRRVAAL